MSWVQRGRPSAVEAIPPMRVVVVVHVLAIPPARAAETPGGSRVAAAIGPCQRGRGMETLELLIGLLAAVAVVVRLAGRTTVPEPVLLVLAGLAVALIPGLPRVELDPE